MWTVGKALQIPLDTNVKDLSKLPYTISYVIRKRVQEDNYSELPKEKRPPEKMVWDGTVSELDEWLDRVLDNKHETEFDIEIDESEIG